MASKAEKDRKRRASRLLTAGENKGGRPRRKGVPRTAGGKVDYRQMESAEKVRATATGARVRHFGCAPEEGSDPRWGYALGRLCLAGFGGGEGYSGSALLEAGNRMHADFERYYAVTGIPSPSPRAQDLTRVRGLTGSDRQDEARKATNRIMGLEGALALVDEQGKPVMSLVKRLILRDEDTRDWTPAMIAKTKRGLRALVVFYGLDASEGLAT